MAAVPGAVPGAFPATPDTELQAEPTYDQVQPQHQHRHHRHHHSQRNKLHKSGDPRGHNYSDSGVGITDSDPLPPQAEDFNQRYSPSDGGFGSIDQNYSHQSSYTFQPDRYDHALDASAIRGAERQPIETQPVESHMAETQLAEDEKGTHDASEAFSGAGVHEEAEENRKTQNTTPPYWGNLPKSARGGIYNTVAGHGSPCDDHAEHHHMPQRGGVYNTVAGHGSGDEESQRHAEAYPNEQDTRRPTGTSLAAALLPDVAEEREKAEQVDRRDTQAPQIAHGFLPETSVGDDVMLASYLADNKHGTPRSSQPDPHAAYGAVSRSHQTSSSQQSTAAPRAFPLSKHHDDHQPEPPTSDTQTKDNLLTGAAGLSTGSAASAATKPKKIQKQKASTSVDSDDRSSKDDFSGKDHSVTRAASPHRHKEKEETHVQRKSRQDSSPSGEKKRGVFGLFRRHKDDKNHTDELATSEPTAEHKKSNPDEPSDHRKTEVATAAAGAGAYRLLHHHKDHDDKKYTEPVDRQFEPYTGSKQMSANESAAATVAESAGGSGVMYQKPSDQQAPEELPQQSRHRSTRDRSGDASKGLSGNKDVAATVAESAGAFGVLYQHPGDEKTAEEKPTEEEKLHRHSRRRSTKDGSDDKDATSNGAKSGGVFGFLHRKSADERRSNEHKSRSRSRKGTRNKSVDLSGNKDTTATAAGTAGAFEQKSSSGSRHATTENGSTDLSHNQRAAEMTGGSAGVFRSLYQKPEENAENDNLLQTHSSTNMAPDAPSPSPKRLNPSPPTTLGSTDSHEPRRSVDQYHAYPVAAGSAMAAGHGAHHFAGAKDNSAYTSHPNTSPSTLEATSAFENPREPPTAPLDTVGGSDTGHRRSARTPSPTTQDITAGHVSRHSGATNEPGDYKVLASGTASGINTGTRHSSQDDHGNRAVGAASTEVHSKGTDVSDSYNHLPSGTPSGVKVQPKSSHGSRSSAKNRSSQEGTHQGDSQYDARTSGTQPGVNFSHHRKASIQESQGPETQAAPLLSRGTESQAKNPEPAAKHMSPEVLPSAYTSSASRSISVPTARDDASSKPYDARDMAHSYEADRSLPASRNPALAAATGAWASKAGTSSGPGAPSAVIHKCEHCGRNNDISSYFSY